MYESTYTILYKDLPIGTEILGMNTFSLITVVGQDDDFKPDEEIKYRDGAYYWGE